MATISEIKTVPHTRIENSVIDDMAHIGVYGYAVYSMIKRHLNHKTTQCNPSYATIARKIGIDRGTVIRYVKKLKALHLISPLLRFKEDGSPTSNQYHFRPAENAAAAKKIDKAVQTGQDSSTEPPPVVAEDNQGSGPEPPKPASSTNNKQRTMTEVDLMPTERQKTCAHPRDAIVFLPDNITICHHCYGLLDEHLTLREEDKAAHAVCAA